MAESKTAQLAKKYGGIWTYDNQTSWWCDDGRRMVARTASCMCDESCNHPPRYWLYGEGEPDLVFFAGDSPGILERLRG